MPVIEMFPVTRIFFRICISDNINSSRNLERSSNDRKHSDNNKHVLQMKDLFNDLNYSETILFQKIIYQYGKIVVFSV